MHAEGRLTMIMTTDQHSTSEAKDLHQIWATSRALHVSSSVQQTPHQLPAHLRAQLRAGELHAIDHAGGVLQAPAEGARPVGLLQAVLTRALQGVTWERSSVSQHDTTECQLHSRCAWGRSRQTQRTRFDAVCMAGICCDLRC